jgi:hypothetical protein
VKLWWIVAAVAVWWFFFRDDTSAPVGTDNSPPDPVQPLPGAPNTMSACGSVDGAPKTQQSLQMPGARGTPVPVIYGDASGFVPPNGSAPPTTSRDQITANWFAGFTRRRAQNDSNNKFYTSPVGQI